MSRKGPGFFVRLDANYDNDEAIWLAGPSAELLFIRSLVYAKRKHSDGHIPSRALPVIGARFTEPLEPLAETLVELGLWQPADDKGGWRIKGWAKWQLTTDEIRGRSQTNRENALRLHHGQGRHQDKPHDACPLCASGMRVASASHADKTRQDKTREGGVGGNGASPAPPQAATPTTPRSKGTRIPEGWSPSDTTRSAMEQENPQVDLDRELVKFRDYWTAATGSKASKRDWDATFRNWIRNGVDRRSAALKPRATQERGGWHVHDPYELEEDIA